MFARPVDRARAAAIPTELRRGRRAISPPPSLGRAVEGVISAHPAPAAAGGPAFARIARAWPDIVGPEAAALSSPVKLTGRGAKGTLHLAARGPAAVVVQADAARILARVNTFAGAVVAGKLAVSRVAVRSQASVGAPPPSRPPSPPPLDAETRAALHKSLADVSHPALKRALEQLGEAVLARDPRRRCAPAPKIDREDAR